MNQAEFKRTVFSLSERLFPMVSRMLGNNGKAEDAIQEIMMKLWTKRKEIERHPNISGFVILTARNYCIDLLRKKQLEIDDSPFRLELLPSEHGHNQLEWEELNTIIKEILNDLSKNQRDILIMRDLDGYEFIEIAAATQLKVEYVRVLLSRARKSVSKRLEKIYSCERT